VWIGAAPYFMFIPDANHDDKADGPPQILLDGFAYQDTHETLNAFTWGPDGWLYGCHGVFTHSRVGKPGTPDDQRVPINAGVWRYHPTKHIFEVFAEGSSNPLGRRLERPRAGVYHRVRHPAPVPRDPGRALLPSGGAALLAVRLSRHPDDRRPRPLAGRPGPARR
jgi:hypothetical protein